MRTLTTQELAYVSGAGGGAKPGGTKEGMGLGVGGGSKIERRRGVRLHRDVKAAIGDQRTRVQQPTFLSRNRRKALPTAS